MEEVQREVKALENHLGTLKSTEEKVKYLVQGDFKTPILSGLAEGNEPLKEELGNWIKDNPEKMKTFRGENT